jgi:acyl carrier protein
MTMEDRIRKVFAAVFQVPADNFAGSFTKDTFSQWDSLKHVTLALALENEFGIRFEDDEYERLQSFESIVSLVRGKISP